MNINIDKITEVIIRDDKGKIIAAIKPGMWETQTMQNKSKKLIIQQSKS